ncbi:MAG: glycine/sarcosine/betaine reductase complex component C subunit alpha [Synergistaceae bacterium]|nr:glycine/sarcosine/betaine reductase complex component C subunit alpha [Synergistaceae bacterium]
MTDIKKLVGESLTEIIEAAKHGGPRVKVGLMASGSELGCEELALGARLALETGSIVQPVMIGPRVEGFDELDWIETDAGSACEAEIANALEAALKDGRIAAAVALHYPFPLGVTTIGRVVTPARGRAMLIAATTGTSSANRGEAMLRNALYGIATAKALGIKEPTVGILNVDTAQPVFRALTRLAERGYKVKFGSSVRKDGGAVLRGNDILAGAVDVCVADALTGNVLMKMFSSFSTGGSYEALGWGYGPSCGEGWKGIVSIISRASGAPVIAGALSMTAAAAAGNLPGKVAEEIAAARKAGLDEEIAALTPKAAAEDEAVKAPPQEPTDEELHGVDVLEIENAVRALWKAGIYAESAMGCTGPVVKLAAKNTEKGEAVLKENGYL